MKELIEDYLNRDEDNAKVLSQYSTRKSTVKATYLFNKKEEDVEILLSDLLVFLYNKIK